MNQRPKISFVCSVRNGSEDIERCVGSVLNQDFSDIELILVDDHSTDSTWALMESVAKRDDRVRAIRNYGREGLTYSLNMGIDFCRGEYIARIDVDDFAHSTRAEEQMRVLDDDSSAVMVASCSRMVDEYDYEMYSHCPSSDSKALLWSLCLRNNIRHSTAMWRRSLDLRYDPWFKYAQDYEMWCRMTNIGKIAVVPKILATLKNKTNSITNTKRDEQEFYADTVASRMFEKYTGDSLDVRQSRCLRMIHHLKSQEQFIELEGMTEGETREAMKNYLHLVEMFANKEGPNIESIKRDVVEDIKSMIANPKHGSTAKESVGSALSRGFKPDAIAEEMARVISQCG